MNLTILMISTGWSSAHLTPHTSHLTSFIFLNLLRVAEAGNDALYAVHQKTYEVGCIPCMLYVASGGSLDWTLGELGIPYSYGMELRDTGAYGFLLPPQQIIPTGEEVWAFHLTVARELIKEFVP